MNLVKNITSIIVNLSTLLWYGFTKLAIHVEEIIDTLWISSEGEQIKRDYDDYDPSLCYKIFISELVKYSEGGGIYIVLKALFLSKSELAVQFNPVPPE